MDVFSTIRRLLLTSFGLGLFRPAPGTWASLPPVLLVLTLVMVLGSHWSIDAMLALLAFAFSIVCVRFGAEAEIIWGRKDPSEVVADEVAGQSVALLFLPWLGPGAEGAFTMNAAMALVSFVAFRFFDIVKPPPARQLQALRGGWGILIDDLIAGVLALIVTQVFVRLFVGV